MQGFLSVVHSGTYYELSQRHDFVPRLTEKQKEALQLFSALAQDQALKMEFLLQPGDIQLLNNHTQQHQRSSFRVSPHHGPSKILQKGCTVLDFKQ